MTEYMHSVYNSVHFTYMLYDFPDKLETIPNTPESKPPESNHQKRSTEDTGVGGAGGGGMEPFPGGSQNLPALAALARCTGCTGCGGWLAALAGRLRLLAGWLDITC